MKICLIAEGCYPYVAGGVSSWIQMLMEGMPEHQFVICTIAASTQQKGQFKYRLPANVAAVEENFLDQIPDIRNSRPSVCRLTAEEKQALLDLISRDHTDWNLLFDLFARGGRYTAAQFLTSDAFLDLVMESCRDTYRQVPFNGVFWTIRSMLLPVLNLLQCHLPEADVYHAVSTGYAGLLGALFHHKTGKPFLITEHGIYSREREEEILKARWVDVYFKQTWIDFFMGMAREAYSQAGRIISLFYHARDLQIGYGADPDRCIVVPNGIQVERFDGIGPIPETPHSLVLGAVVRVVPIKDLKTMIYSFAQVRQKLPDARFYLIGPTDEDPEYYQECLDLIDSLHLGGVTFTGRVDVAQWYSRLDLVLLGSISEGQPFVVLEAMASRRPVVATDVGSCRELLEGNGDGLGPAGEVVPVMNPNLMARSILRLAADPERMRWMAENGRRRVERFYREEDFLQAYRKLYEKAEVTWQA